MPRFEYKGLTKAGKNTHGNIDADSLRVAQSKLKREGIFIIDIKSKRQPVGKKSKKSYRGTASTEDMSLITRQLATLLKADIPLVETLGAVSDQIETPLLKDALSEIKNQVTEGQALHKSLKKYPHIFNKTYVSMCEAGEMSGTLDVILLRLAEFTEAEDQLNKKVKSAMLYPAIMLVFSMLMLMGLFIYVIPKITTIFEQSPELTLPWYSEMVINFSGFLVNYWFIVLVGSMGCYSLFHFWKRTPAGSVTWDKTFLKIPLMGPLARMVAVSRFTRTLATLLTGGVPMLQALDIVKNVVNNAVLATAVENARDNISEGESIAAPLKKSNQFPPIVIHMIKIGERTGDLENMLTQVADAFDFQVKTKVDGLTSLLEPLFIIFIGAIIGVIVMSIMIPIFELSNIGR